MKMDSTTFTFFPVGRDPGDGSFEILDRQNDERDGIDVVFLS